MMGDASRLVAIWAYATAAVAAAFLVMLVVIRRAYTLGAAGPS